MLAQHMQLRWIELLFFTFTLCVEDPIWSRKMLDVIAILFTSM